MFFVLNIMTTDSTRDLSLQEVADELGVHYMTAYRYVRIGVLPARKEGRSWRIGAADLEAFTAPESAGPPGRRDAPWADRLVSRLIAGDEAGAWVLLEAALAAGADPAEVVVEVITPAMREIGDRWESSDIGVDEEHMASGICTRLLARLGGRFARRGVSRGVVVMGTTESDLHGLPLAIAAELLRLEGFEVLNLGALLPADDFARSVARTERLVAVGIGATIQDPQALARTIKAVKEVSPAPVFAGGAGVPSKDDALEAGATAWAPDAQGLLALVEAAAAA